MINLETLKTITFIFLLIWGTVAGYQWYSGKDNVPPQKVDELVDERTRVQSAEIVDLKDINTFLRNNSKAQEDMIRDRDEKILILTEAQARLNLYQDSIRTLNRRLTIADITVDTDEGTTFIDTTVTYVTTFTDELFRVTCRVNFSSSGCISIDANLEQLRDIHISTTVTDRGQGFLNAYLHLPDFDLEQTLQFTYQPEPTSEDSFWQEVRPYLVTGVGVAILLYLLQLVL